MNRVAGSPAAGGNDSGPALTRVVLAEDHPSYAEILRLVLQRSGSFEVVATAENQDEALAAIEEQRPHLAVIDVRLPSVDEGLAVAEKARQIDPDMKIVVLTGSDDPHFALRAAEIPVDGYIPKSLPSQSIVDAIRAACAGLKVVSPEVLDLWTQRESDACPLSERQLELLRLAARGPRLEDLVERTLASRSRVYRDLAEIERCLGVDNRTQAVVLAARKGWI